MSRADAVALAKERLNQAAAAINLAAQVLRPHVELFEQFERERLSMESVGPILDPTLFNNSERRAVSAIMAPLFRGAREFVATFDAQVAVSLEALAKVEGGREA